VSSTDVSTNTPTNGAPTCIGVGDPDPTFDRGGVWSWWRHATTAAMGQLWHAGEEMRGLEHEAGTA
jgi:hypothetical protein